jgi:DNA invertase Pin-like site-specific DNA recombinase
MKVVLYARVSTNEQDPEVQLEPLRTHAGQRTWDVAEEFVDHGYSGSRESRPALDRLMKAAWKGRFQAVLVWRFDRFARSTKHLIAALHQFRRLNISFVSLTEQFDTSTPIGEAMFTVLGAMAQLERDIVRERVRAGLQRARSNGIRLGRPMAHVDTDRLRALLDKQLSLPEIGRRLGCCRLPGFQPPACAF